MPRIRSVKPEILEDEKTASLDDASWRLFVSLFVIADDYGNGRAEVRQLAGKVFWAHDDGVKKVREGLARLSRDSRKGSRDSLIVVYEVHEQVYFSIRQFKRHQRVDHPGKPHVPSPPLSLFNNDERIESPTYGDSSRESREVKPRRSRKSHESLAPDLRIYGSKDLSLDTERASVDSASLSIQDIQALVTAPPHSWPKGKWSGASAVLKKLAPIPRATVEAAIEDATAGADEPTARPLYLAKCIRSAMTAKPAPNAARRNDSRGPAPNPAAVALNAYREAANKIAGEHRCQFVGGALKTLRELDPSLELLPGVLARLAARDDTTWPTVDGALAELRAHNGAMVSAAVERGNGVMHAN